VAAPRSRCVFRSDRSATAASELSYVIFPVRLSVCASVVGCVQSGWRVARARAPLLPLQSTLAVRVGRLFHRTEYMGPGLARGFSRSSRLALFACACVVCDYVCVCMSEGVAVGGVRVRVRVLMHVRRGLASVRVRSRVCV
jgi:hypothetical protein